MIGTVLEGKFKVEKSLSRNEDGEVFQGTDLESGEEVVIKLLRPASADSNEQLVDGRDPAFVAVEPLQVPALGAPTQRVGEPEEAGRGSHQDPGQEAHDAKLGIHHREGDSHGTAVS